MKRRNLLAGMIGIGAVGLGGIAYNTRESSTTVTSDDDETTVHHPESIVGDSDDHETGGTSLPPEELPEWVRDPEEGSEPGEDRENDEQDDQGEDSTHEGKSEPEQSETGDEGTTGDRQEYWYDNERGPRTRDDSSGDTEDSDDSTSIEVDFRKENLDRFNSGSVSFIHDVFFVCNRGDSCATIWIEADPIENGHGEPSVEFYPDSYLETTLEEPGAVECLEPGHCLGVGVITRTAGIEADTQLVDEITIRSER